LNFSQTSVGAYDFASFERIVMECFDTTNKNICKKALIEVAAFQRYQESKGNYACQTRLLGLESDLIIVTYEPSHSKIALKLIDSTKIFCGG
tara:strand:+ start:761 stop:1036 length:276 start_codon:yes stop_codon:yes gene_type:complete